MTRNRPRSLATDDRAASTTLSYALNLGISAILVSVLLFATGSVVSDQREAATRDELQVIGQEVASAIEAIDRLNATGASRAKIRVELPATVAGTAYTIEVNTTGNATLVLQSLDPELTVEVPIRNSSDLQRTQVLGGDIVVVLSPDGDVEVRSR